jgi:hypothetical protein
MPALVAGIHGYDVSDSAGFNQQPWLNPIHDEK